MSIDAIKQELASLDVARRNEIIAFLVAMNDRNDSEYQADLTRKIGEKNPANWMTLEELERRFAEKDDTRTQ